MGQKCSNVIATISDIVIIPLYFYIDIRYEIVDGVFMQSKFKQTAKWFSKQPIDWAI